MQCPGQQGLRTPGPSSQPGLPQPSRTPPRPRAARRVPARRAREQGKTNFFEKRVGEYQKSGVMSGLHDKENPGANLFSQDADF